jgi:hypothetical protein
MSDEEAKKSSAKAEKAEKPAAASSSFPKPKQILNMASRLFKDIKTSICSIAEDYKKESTAAKQGEKKAAPKKKATKDEK